MGFEKGCGLLSSELSAFKTVWPWLSGKSPSNIIKCSLFAREQSRPFGCCQSPGKCSDTLVASQQVFGYPALVCFSCSSHLGGRRIGRDALERPRRVQDILALAIYQVKVLFFLSGVPSWLGRGSYRRPIPMITAKVRMLNAVSVYSSLFRFKPWKRFAPWIGRDLRRL